MDLDQLIEEICGTYLERLLACRSRADNSDGSRPRTHGVEYFVREEEQRMAAGDRSLVEADARKLLAEAGHQLDDEEFDELCCALQRTFLRGCWIAHA